MSGYISFEEDKQQIAKEKLKAKDLKKTQWWMNKKSTGICYYCKGMFKPKELTMDHIVPLSRGGKSKKGNVVPCCKECNNTKKYLTPVDMLFNKIKDDNRDNIIGEIF